MVLVFTTYASLIFAFNASKSVVSMVGKGYNHLSAKQGWPVLFLDLDELLPYDPEAIDFDGELPRATSNVALGFDVVFCTTLAVLMTSVTTWLWRKSNSRQRLAFAVIMSLSVAINFVMLPRYHGINYGFHGGRQGIPFQISYEPPKTFDTPIDSLAPGWPINQNTIPISQRILLPRLTGNLAIGAFFGILMITTVTRYKNSKAQTRDDETSAIDAK